MFVSTTYEKLRIVKIKKKQSPSMYKNRKAFSTVMFIDEKKRKIKAMGRWTDGWKERDVVTGFLRRSAYEDDQGIITNDYCLMQLKNECFKDEYLELYKQGVVPLDDGLRELLED
ncbi:hypothetical protein M0R36_11400 [bacterium]|jgi:hypothetical protein|nr:hypothetical protein [bacterium]